MKLRAILPFLLLVISPSLLRSQVPLIWQWGRSAGGSAADVPAGVALDRDGSAIVASTFAGSAFFGGQSISGLGPRTMALARYNAAGDLLWVRASGGAGETHAVGVALDRAGNIYVTGRFKGTISFGSTVLATTGDFDLFLVKYSPGGAVLWATSAGGGEADLPADIAVDSLDNVVIAGTFSGSARFDSVDVDSRGSTDIFVVSWASNGELAGIFTDGGSGADTARLLALDASRRVHVAGTVDGSTLLAGRSHAASVDSTLFLARYDRDGTGLWSLLFGADSGRATVTGLAVDGPGNIWITGSHADTFAIGARTLASQGGWDAWLARLDAAGSGRWLVPLPGTGDERSRDVVIASPGVVWTTGWFTDTLFLNNAELLAQGDSTLYLARFEADGTLSLATQSSGSGSAAGERLAARGREILLLGAFRNAVRVGSDFLTSRGASDLLLARYGEDATIATGAIPYDELCPGAAIDVPYQVTGSFQTGNVFRLELSSASGSFDTAVSIGLIQSLVAGSIRGVIPAGTTPGSGYRLRVTSTQPVRFGAPSPDTIEVSAVPSPTITPNRSLALCQGEVVTLDAGEGYREYLWSNGALTRTITVGSTGSFTVSVTNAAGCTGTSSPVNVLLLPPVEKPIITPITTQLLEASAGSQYQWYLNGDSIPGATTRVYFAPVGGRYRVRVTLANGCSALSDELILDIASVDITDAGRSYVNVRRVVGERSIAIELDRRGDVRTRLFDVTGRLLQDRSDEGIVRLLLGDGMLPPGTYFVVVEGKGWRSVATLSMP